MKFIDTHTHLFSPQFDEDRNVVVQNAIEAGITRMLLPNIDVESIPAMHDLADSFPKNCYPMMGLHPCSVNESWEKDLATIYEWLNQRDYCAIGEIGMDLYWDQSTRNLQEQAFRAQITWAKERKLPVVIHVREAFDETLAIIDELNDERLTGVFHCFTGTPNQAQHIIEYGGFKLGIGGVLTFKNSGVDKVIKEIDLKHLILETDAPYLAPTPKRGKRNESAYLTYIASKLAEIKDCSIEDIAQLTTENAKALFKTVE